MTIHDPAESPQAQLERLVETYGAAIRAYVARRCPADAVDDVVADTFATAWRRIGDVPAGSELPWLYGVARRILANARRADARRGALADRLEAWAPRVTAGDATADADRVHDALLALSDADRELLLLVEVDGLDRADAARSLGVTRSVVRLRLHRARRRFAAAFAEAAPRSAAIAHPTEVPRAAR